MAAKTTAQPRARFCLEMPENTICLRSSGTNRSQRYYSQANFAPDRRGNRKDAVHGLESHVGINADCVKMTVRSGWVTLEGTVDWPYQKILAQSVVKSLKGVVGITNNIEHRAQVCT